MLVGRGQGGESTAVAELMSTDAAAAAAAALDRSDDLPVASERIVTRCLRAGSGASLSSTWAKCCWNSARPGEFARTARPHQRGRAGARSATRSVGWPGGRSGPWQRRCSSRWRDGVVVSRSPELDRRFVHARGGRTADFAGRVAVSQCLGRSDPRFARRQPEPGSRHELGQSSRVRTVPSDRLHQVLQDLRISAERDAGADGDRTSRGLHECATRPVGPVLSIRQCHSHRRHAAGSRSIDECSAQRDGTQRGEPADGHHRTGGDGSTGAGARRPGRAGRAQSDCGETIDHLVRGAASVQRRPAPHATRLASGGAQELRGGHQSGRQLRVRVRALAQSYPTLGFDNEATQASRRDEPGGDAAAAREVFHVRQSLPHRERLHKAIDEFENLASASPNSRCAVRAGQPVRTDRHVGQGARTVRQRRRARSEVRRGPARARTGGDQARAIPRMPSRT